jgi:hypothetical protein
MPNTTKAVVVNGTGIENPIAVRLSRSNDMPLGSYILLCNQAKSAHERARPITQLNTAIPAISNVNRRINRLLP